MNITKGMNDTIKTMTDGKVDVLKLQAQLAEKRLQHSPQWRLSAEFLAPQQKVVELQKQLEAVRSLQRYEVEPDMMDGNPPVCGTPDDEGDWVRFDELQKALNGEDDEQI